jgi:hypothetical protein
MLLRNTVSSAPRPHVCVQPHSKEGTRQGYPPCRERPAPSRRPVWTDSYRESTCKQ